MTQTSSPVLDGPLVDPQTLGDPDFGLRVFTASDDPEDVVFLTSFLPEGGEDRHASMGLLFGVALMLLIREGAVEKLIQRMLSVGPISHAKAIASLTLMTSGAAND